jgi:hypothetical protein
MDVMATVPSMKARVFCRIRGFGCATVSVAMAASLAPRRSWAETQSVVAAFVQPVPVQSAAVQPAAVQPAAAQPAPVQSAAVQPAPVQPAAGAPNALSERAKVAYVRPSEVPVYQRVHTLAELSLGVLALPFAPLSERRRGGSFFIGPIGRGDATPLLGLNVRVHDGQWFAAGAALQLGISPTSDDQYGGSTGLVRVHSRSYMTLEGEARLIPFRSGRFEGWFGGAGGVAIISDRFATDAGLQKPTVLGVQTYSLGTQGLLLGLRGGVSWNAFESLAVGLVLKGDMWVLPSEGRCTPIGDCAAVTGINAAFQLALTVGYRIPL